MVRFSKYAEHPYQNNLFQHQNTLHQNTQLCYHSFVYISFHLFRSDDSTSNVYITHPYIGYMVALFTTAINSLIPLSYLFSEQNNSITFINKLIYKNDNIIH